MAHARRSPASWRALASRRCAPVVLVFVFFWPRPAQAWNPLAAAARGLHKVGNAIGSFVGAQVSGLVEKAAAPTIHDLGETGHELIADVDVRLDRQVEHASSVAAKLVGEVDVHVGETIDHVDRSLAARLLQVQTSGDELLDRTFARLNGTLGRLDTMVGRRIEQVLAGSKVLLHMVDDVTARAMATADAILAQRIEEVHQLVATSVEQVDRVAAARIDQLDEVAGRRLGNLDVIATKQSLALEGGLLRIAALVGLVGLVGFVFWRLFVEIGRAQGLVTSDTRRVRQIARHASPRLGLQILVAAIGGAALLWLGHVLPMKTERLAGEQRAAQLAGFKTAMHGYDFTAMRYHAAQLEILDPENAAVSRAMVRKAELLRTVLQRPALLQSLPGIASIQTELASVEAAVDEADRSRGGPGKDRDLLVLKAYILWQVGAGRADEQEAAALCAEAIETPPGRLAGNGADGFLLEELAWSYLGLYLANPYEVAGTTERVGKYDLARLRSVLARRPKEAEPPPSRFEPMLAYDRLVVELMRKATPAYLGMLRAHADYLVARAGVAQGQPEPAAARAAWQKRQDLAAQVVDAWMEFDQALESSPWLASDTLALAVFTLDDAVPMRARYFLLFPAATTLAPAFFSEAEAPLAPAAKAPAAKPAAKGAAAAQAEHQAALLRLEMAPPRVAWERRYAPLLGPGARDVLAFEEATRFRALEQRDQRFEEAFVALLVLARQSGPAAKDLAEVASAAALGAAQLGLYEPQGDEGQRVAVATLVLDTWKQAAGGNLEVPAELSGAIRDGYERRPLRLF